MKESILIDKIYSKLKSSAGFGDFGPEGDDGVVLPGDGFNESLVLSTDSFVEGTHFNHEVGYRCVGWKSLVSSVSDIYAMGVQPSFYTLNLVLPSYFKEKYFDDFLEGLQQASEAYHVKIVGGDITRGPCFMAAYQVGGYAMSSQVKSLKGVSSGDVLFTDSLLGYPKLGFEFFKAGDHKSEYVHKFLWPSPNKELALWLGSLAEVTAITDISDGLILEIQNMLKGKNLKFQLDELNWSPQFERDCKSKSLDPEKTALEGGEEYDFLWSIKPQAVPEFLRLYKLKFKKLPQMLGNFVGSMTSKEGTEKIIYHNKRIFSELNTFSHF